MADTDRAPHGAGSEALGAYAERLAAAVDDLRAAEGLEVRVDEPMRQHTSLGVGGPADICAIVCSVEGVCAAMSAARLHGLPLVAVGRGTNLLVLDGGVRGIVLQIGREFAAIGRAGCRVTAQTGATVAEVCEYAAGAGLSGLEFAAGVPGSIGGAVAMNAGAGAGQMADVVESIDVVRETGEQRCCTREKLEFDYRSSCLRDERCVAVGVTFALKPSDPARVRKAMFEAIERRCRKQPLSLGSAGSVFKRPPGDYAGRLLEQAGVKGLRVGGASFSAKHANFIVNEGNANAADIMRLIEMAKQRVHEASGVWLEEEVCVLGESLE
jgi:UDP-N-acetylmuramate dehydrogenase